MIIFGLVYLIWIGIGSISGAFISAYDKIDDISKEKEPNYKNKTAERPIRIVYHTSRVAGFAGLGAFCGGGVAATAPISVPLYIYWKGKDVPEENDDINEIDNNASSSNYSSSNYSEINQRRLIYR